MSLSLRVFLLLMALVFLVIIVRTINKKKLHIQYSFPWMLIAAAMLLLAIFPQIAVFLCSVTGIQTPSNLIYLMGIVILLLISFYQTILISRQANRIVRLTQILSIVKKENEDKWQEQQTNTK